jgi:hypothetical protein
VSAAEVLAQHQWRGNLLGCGCGWNWPEELTYFCGEEERITKAHIEHQVEALQAAGYAVVELPTPIDPEYPHEWGAPGARDGQRWDVWLDRRGVIQLRLPESVDPDTVAKIAGGLMAAHAAAVAP